MQSFLLQLTDQSVSKEGMVRLPAEQRAALTESRRTLILKAALQLFSDRGFEATSMETLAAAAGVAKGTLYLYFPTKDALRDAIFDEYGLLEDVAERVLALGDVPPETTIRVIVEEIWRLLHEREAVVRLLMAELQRQPARAREFHERVVQRGDQLLTALFTTEAERGRLRPVDGVVAGRTLVGMVLSMFLSQQIWAGKELDPLTDAQITGTITDVFLNGLLPRPSVAPSQRKK